MRILYLRISGFGPHVDTMIDFTEMGGQVAYFAPYGTGKTFLFEAPYACLYGSFLWYQGSIYDALTQGGTGEGEIAMEFEHGGAEYGAARTVRDTGKTRTQRATLCLFDGDYQPIAGPNVSDFEAAVEQIVGDADTCKSTNFLSQNRAGDLCGQPGEPDLVARRRAVFFDLIGAADLDRLEARAAEELRKAKATTDVLESQLAGEGDIEDEIGTELGRLEAASLDLEKARECLSAAEAELEHARANLRDASGGDGELQARIDSCNAAFDSLGAAENAHEQAEEELRRDSQTASYLDGNRQAVMRRGVLIGNRDRLKKYQETHDAQERWMEFDNQLLSRVISERMAIDDLEKSSGVGIGKLALADKLPAIRDEGITAKAANEARTLRNHERADNRSKLNSLIDAHQARIASITERMKAAPNVLFGDKCLPCPLMAEYAELPKQLESHNASVRMLGADLDAIEPDEELIDLVEIRGRYEQAKAASDAVDRAVEARKTIDRRRTDLEALERDLSEHRKSKPEGEPVDDQSDIIAEIGGQIEELNGADERLKSCQEAADRLPGLKAKVAEAIKRVIEAKTVYTERLPAAESAKKALADREQQRQALTSAVEAKGGAVKVLRAEADALTSLVARHEARVAELERRRNEQQEKRGQLEALKNRAAALADNRACWGPRGVRQILIDDAAPELEAIADDLFERATGGRMRLRIATQKVNGDGSIAEDFKILIRDRHGERDALRYSGGQLQLILIVFRVAVAIWSSRIRGTQPDSLYLDEACDRLGADGTEDLMRVLEYLRDRFRQIIIVTHDIAIAERMESYVRLVGGIGGVSVEVGGKVAASCLSTEGGKI